MSTGGPISSSRPSAASFKSYLGTKWLNPGAACISCFVMLIMPHRCYIWNVISNFGDFIRHLRLSSCLTNGPTDEGGTQASTWCRPRARKRKAGTTQTGEEGDEGQAPCAVVVEGDYYKLESSRKEKQGRPDEKKATVVLLGPSVYSCGECRVHHLSSDGVISKGFQGRGGKAFLVENLVNYWKGPPAERMLMTGLHAVADVYCTGCDTLIGWTYERAFEHSQKYKEGKFVIEKTKLLLEEL
mmetsp:Transcript_4598/g.6340  ORF Transcript_4598/g.6340 Transcript_4598/m.6340 type:complete len:242 (+) Transcript_4598:89-814(+)